MNTFNGKFLFIVFCVQCDDTQFYHSTYRSTFSCFLINKTGSSAYLILFIFYFFLDALPDPKRLVSAPGIKPGIFHLLEK